MKFAFAGDDFFIDCYNLLLGHGHELVGAWVPERDNLYNYNQSVKELCRQENVTEIDGKIEQADLSKLIEEGLELLVVGFYPHKVPTAHLPKYHLNMHPSLLPIGRGPNPIPVSILRQETRSGMTFHKITDGYDEGDIILQQEFALQPNENHDSLSIKHMYSAVKLMTQFVSDIDCFWDAAKSQGEAGSYWTASEISQRDVHWDMTANEIDLMVRAFGRYGVRAKIGDATFKITKAICWQEDHEYGAGAVIMGHANDIALTCSDGIVCLTGIHPLEA